MSRFTKAIGFLVVWALAAFALPASADNKSFYITAPTSASVTSTTITVGLTNDPASNASFTSFSLTGTPTGLSTFTITGASVSPGNSPTPTISTNGTAVTVTFTNLSPVKVGNTLSVKLTVNMAASNGCSNGSLAWTADPWTGSQTNPSNHFTLLTNKGNLTTTVTSSCTMSFVNSPADALVNAVIKDTAYGSSTSPTSGNPVQVKLLVNGSPVAGQPVSLASSCDSGGLTLSGNSGVSTSATGVATFSSLASSSTGAGCTLTASATGFSGAGPTSKSKFTVSTASLAFVNQPNNALQGVTVTNTSFNSPPGDFVSVQLNLTPAPSAFPATPVTLSSTCTGISGGTANTNTSGLATFGTLNFQTAGQSCTLTASALGVSSSPSNTFGIAAFAPQGQVDCNQDLPLTATLPPELQPGGVPVSDAANQPGYVLAHRGSWNAKGTPCTLVSFQFTNKLLTVDNIFVHTWDTVTQPGAVFYYVSNSQPRFLNLVTLTPDFVPPKVSWETGSNGNPINELPALGCLSPNLAQPYGRIPAGGLAASATSVTLDTSNPPPGGWQAMPTVVGAEFPMNLGLERVLATVNSTGGLDLTRGQAGTTPTDQQASTYAMSTAMPIDPRPFGTGPGQSPYSGKAVHACMAAYGFMTYTPDPDTGDPRYFQTSVIFAFGDFSVRY